MKTAKNLNWRLTTVIGCLILCLMICFAAMVTIQPRALADGEHTHVSTGENVATLTHKAVCDDCGESYVTLIDKVEMTSPFNFTNVKYGDIGQRYQSGTGYAVVIKNNPSCKVLEVKRKYTKYSYTEWDPRFWGAGEYQFVIFIEVMSGYRDIYDFAPTVAVEVNGEAWTGVKSGTTLSCKSPAFTIEETEIELIFHNFNGWIPSREVGESYSSTIIKNYVFGGKKPYTFSKVSGPDWVKVAEDGTLSGTPTDPAPETRVGIRVTDADGVYKEISFLVGKVEEAIVLDELSVLDKLEVLTDFTPPVYGEKRMDDVSYVSLTNKKDGVNVYKIDKIKYLIGGKEEYFKDSAAYLGTDDVFGEGKYTVVLHFYNYIENPRYYKFDETIEVFIDGTPWQILKVETDEKRSHIFVYKEYELGPSVHTKHVSTGENVATRTHKAVCDVCGESYRTAINYIKMTATVDTEGIKYGDVVLTKKGDYGFKIVNYPDGMIDFSDFYLNPYEARYCKYYTEGVYSHKLYLKIAPECQDIFYFSSDVEGEVNGKSWRLSDKGLMTCAFESPAFTIIKTESVLKFDDIAATISEQEKGVAITPIDLNAYVLGGKKPYTFTKISGPTWLTVATDGTVSGTPDRGGRNEALVIRITDANGKTYEASVWVGETYVEVDPTTLPELKKITITSDFTAPVLGDKCKFEYTFTVTDRSDIFFYPMRNSVSENVMWLKGIGENRTEMEPGEQFGINTYTALICAVRFHVGENDFRFAEDLEVSVNGETWNVDVVYSETQCAQAILYKEFNVTDTGHVHEYGDLIKEVSATCVTKGMKAHYECSICRALFDESKTAKTAGDLEIPIDPTAHKFGEWNTEQKANCATVGVKAHKTCEHCKSHFDESENKIAILTIPKNNDHDLADGWSKSPEEHYRLCKRNGCKDENKVDCATHTPDRAEATEDDPVVCTICQYVITPVKGHEHSVTFVKGYPKTCTENGQKDYYECSDGAYPCHKRFKDAAGTQEIPDDSWIVIFAQHDFTWIEEVPATVEADGVKAHRDCTACHKHFDENGNEVTDADLKIDKLPQPEQSKEKKGGLSGGAIAGIVIGSVVVVGVGGFAIFWFVIKKKTWADFIALFKKSK